MLFDSWYGLLRVCVVGVIAYAALILVLRMSGKRTLSKWNAFDVEVTIALGSIIATILISKDVALVEGVAAFSLLILLQYLITSASVKYGWFARVMKSEPTLLLDRGVIQQSALRKMRVTESEVKAALRASGLASYRDVYAVVLETDGSFSVIKSSGHDEKDALSDIRRINSLHNRRMSSEK